MQTELEFIQQFQDLRTTGTYETFKEHEDGSPYRHSSISYVNGKLQGLKEKFYSNGHLKSKKFVLPNGLTKKLLKYSNENNFQDYETWTYPNEEDAGTFEYRSFRNGVLNCILPYVGFNAHGLWKASAIRHLWMVFLFDQGTQITRFHTQPVQLDQIDPCSICFATPDQMVEPITLACHVKHTFCFQCLKPELLKGNRKCYLCRKPIRPTNF